MSLRLLPGPQDPFCLGRAKLGLSLRHFRQEAPAACSGVGLESEAFHLLCGFWEGRELVFRASPW